MSSRQEQKERAREERVALEERDRRAADRKKRLQYVVGGVLALAAVAAVAAALIVGLGGGDDETEGPKQAGQASGLPKLPEARETDLAAAATAAGCKVTNAKFEGQSHQEKQFTPADYKTNPPTSGDHAPNWYEDGIYAPGDAPEIGQTVHTLEHGRIDVQYRRGSATPTVQQLESFVSENDGYHMVMFENATNMPYAVAATAWTQMLGCTEVNDRTWDALRTFRDEYIDKGPEKVP